MAAETYIPFQTFDDENNQKEHRFDLYKGKDRPECGGGIFILLEYLEHSEPKFYYIGSSTNFSKLFSDEMHNNKLKKYPYNSVLVYECDVDEMYDTHRLVEKSVMYQKFFYDIQ